MLATDKNGPDLTTGSARACIARGHSCASRVKKFVACQGNHGPVARQYLQDGKDMITLKALDCNRVEGLELEFGPHQC